MSSRRKKEVSPQDRDPRPQDWLSAAMQSEHLRSWLAAVALVLAVFFAYQPAWHGGFVWDDDLHLLNNPVIHRADGLARAWTSGDYINYWPLTFTVYRLEYDTWGIDPLGYHLVNIALHAVSALLVWRILKHLQIPGAMLAAAIFSLHPVNVESVAWIAQLKNVLSLALALLSMLFYLRHDRDGGWWQFAVAVGLFLLSALAKGMMLTMPVVLLACAWWQRGRIGRIDLLRVLPYVLISAVMVWIELSRQHAGIGGALVRSDGILGRAAVAGCAVWFYLWKTVWPVNLMFVYPRWTITARDLWAYLPGVSLAAMLAVAWWRRHSWGRPVVMFLVCYVALLLPVLGFADIVFMQYSLVADHWQYAAMIVPCAAMVALFSVIARWLAAWPFVVAPSGGESAVEGRLKPELRTTLPFAGYVLSLVLLAVLAMLTFRQSRMYANIETLYRTTVAQNPGCWLVQNNLGSLLAERGQFLASRGKVDDAMVLYREAIAHQQDAVKAKPDYINARIGLGSALARLERMDEAIAEFQRALDIDGNSVEAHCSLGKALAQQGRIEEAVSQYRDALKIDGDDLSALNDLAWLRATYPQAAFRNAAETIRLAEHALELSNGRGPNATVLDTLAAAYANAGRFAEASQAGRRALDLATLQGNPALAQKIMARLRLYMAKKPYRQPAATRPSSSETRSDAR